MSDDALYVYGVVAGRARLPTALQRRGLRLVRSDGVAALVGHATSGPLAATRANVLAHADVVESAFAWTTVLPMRFGLVLEDERAVRTVVLEQHRDALVQLLDRHAETAELTLKAAYDEDRVLAELAGRRRITQLHARYRASPSVANGIELGEAIAAALDDRRTQDAERILSALAPAALEVRVGEGRLANDVASLALLIEKRNEHELEQRVEQLSADLSPPIHFKLTGPLPPYSFVELPQAVAA